MTSMDIIEALGGIDPALILDAKKPSPRRIPGWLKWASAAACICCLLTAVMLSFQQILAPAHPANIEQASTNEVIAENNISLTSTEHALTLSVPLEYADNILIDTPLISEKYDGINSDTNLNLKNIPFTFYTDGTNSFDQGGFVWCIVKRQIEDYDADYYTFYESSVLAANFVLLGSDENYIYELMYPMVSEQIDASNYDGILHYAACANAGYDMLIDFCRENNISGDHSWTTRYQDKIVTPLNELMSQQDSSVHNTILTSEKYGLSISVPDAYVNEITVDTPFDYTVSQTGAYIYSFENIAFCFQDTSQTNDFYIPETDPGYVFMISVYDTSEYVKGDYYDLHLTFTNAVLGTKGDLTYIVTYPIPEFQCDETYENVSSYYDHIWAAYEILEDFVKRNGLNDDGDWKKRYTEHMITTSDDFENTLGISVNVSSNSGAILKCPAVYEYLFTVDQTHTDGKYTDVSYENMIFGYYNRPSKNEVPELIWGIVTFPMGEYPYKNFEEETYAYNHVLLGSDERFDYALLYQADHEFAFASSEDAETFFHRASDGMEVIRDFIRINKLSDGSSWELTFSSRVLKPVWDNLKYMKEFEK